MAIGPIDYSSALPELDVSPLYALQRQLELRRANKAQEAIDREKLAIVATEAQREEEEEAAWRLDVEGVLENPSTEGYQRLFRHPKKLEAAKQLLGNYTDGQRTRNLNAAMEVGGLLNAGNTDLALKKLQDRRTALVNAGESTEITDSMIADLESGDPARINRAKGIAGTVIATSVDPDKAGPLLDRLGYSATYSLDREKFEEDKRHNLVTERQGDARVDLSAAAGARAAAKAATGGKGGTAGASGGYEYRIGPDGKLQRRKVR